MKGEGPTENLEDQVLQRPTRSRATNGVMQWGWLACIEPDGRPTRPTIYPRTEGSPEEGIDISLDHLGRKDDHSGDLIAPPFVKP